MRWSTILILDTLLVVDVGGPIFGESGEPANQQVYGMEVGVSYDGARVSPTPSVPGSIFGTVISRSGARLSGAIITLSQDERGTIQEVVSGEMGVFRATRLNPGVYQITAQLPGFQLVTMSEVVVQGGDFQTVKISMEQDFTIEDQITVIGSAPKYGLEASEIRESASRDVGEALAQRAGIWRVRKGAIANDVVLRGFQGRDLNVLIDGQRVYGACPNNMDPSAFHVDFAEVDRVDFAKGPFDVKNEGGLGGSVSIITRRPRQGWQANANLAFGSFGFVNPSAYASFADERFSVLGGYSFRVSDPYTDGTGRKFTELTNYRSDAVDRNAFEVGSLWTRLGISLSQDHHLQVGYARQQANDVLYPYLKMDAVYDDTDRIGFRWDARSLGDTVTDFSVQGYYTKVSHWMTDSFRTSAMGSRGYSMGTLAATRTTGGRFEAALMNSWEFGFEAYNRFWGASTEMAKMGYLPQYSLPDVDVFSAGVYAEYEKPLTDTLAMSVGIRIDRVESNADGQKANADLYRAYHGTDSLSSIDVFPSGNFRLQYESKGGIGLGFGAGSAVQVPEPTERYFALKRMGSDWVGNPDLFPSRNNGIEGNFTLERFGLFLQTDLFINWVNDFVALLDQPRKNPIYGIMNSTARSYGNVDAQLWGGELSIALPLHDRLFLSGDLSYVRGTKAPVPELGLTSTNLAEMPPFRSRVGIRYDDGRFFGVVEGVLSAAQTRTDLDLNEEKTPSYAMLNLSAGTRRGRMTLTAGIGNLFNRAYAEHLSYQRDPFRSGIRVTEPGRNVFVNVGVNF